MLIKYYSKFSLKVAWVYSKKMVKYLIRIKYNNFYNICSNLSEMTVNFKKVVLWNIEIKLLYNKKQKIKEIE